MSRSVLLVGVAGIALTLAAPVAAQECSGLGCIFGGSRAAPQQPDASQALQANEQAARSDAAGDAKGGAAGEPGAAASNVKRKPSKPVHVVTIAANAPELARMKGLVAALPKEKIKLVPAKADADSTKTDFTVSTALDPSEGAEKARLFTEQMHVVAGADIKAIPDLEGKVVSFGPDKSPSQAAGRKALEALNVHVQETPLDLDNALDGLATGDVAAVVVLAPQPVEQLKTVSAPGVHLVPWPESGTLPNGAVPTTIDAAAYPALAKPGEKITAMGVDATLLISAKGEKQGAAKTFLKSLTDHSEALTKRGFDLIKADLGTRSSRHYASADRP